MHEYSRVDGLINRATVFQYGEHGAAADLGAGNDVSGALRAKVERLLAILSTGHGRESGHNHAFAVKLMDQVGPRLLRGKTIPHGKKIFSVFEPHTR